jgi:hypothetical protein
MKYPEQSPFHLTSFSSPPTVESHENHGEESKDANWHCVFIDSTPPMSLDMSDTLPPTIVLDTKLVTDLGVPMISRQMVLDVIPIKFFPIPTDGAPKIPIEQRQRRSAVVMLARWLV